MIIVLNQPCTKTKTTKENAKWAGSDLNQRPPPCQGKLLSKEISSTDGSKSKSHDFWCSFRSYLSKNNNHIGTRDRLNYAMKYAYILDTGDARELLELSHEKRMHIMKSLSALAKYTGRYDRWQQVRQRFQLTANPGYATSLFFVTSDVPANPAPTISSIVTSSYVIMIFEV
jgi:hypothetical protein